jgi:hypothetical protein
VRYLHFLTPSKLLLILQQLKTPNDPNNNDISHKNECFHVLNSVMTTQQKTTSEL